MTERRLSLSLVLVAAQLGCSYANGVKQIAGSHFPLERVVAVKAGMTEDEVRATLGDPFEVRPMTTETSWRYYYQVQQKSTTRLLGIVISQTLGQTWEREVLVVFRDGAVVSVRNK